MCYQDNKWHLVRSISKTFTFMYIDSPASIAMLTYNLRIISAQPLGPISCTFNGAGPTMVTSWTIEEIGYNMAQSATRLTTNATYQYVSQPNAFVRGDVVRFDSVNYGGLTSGFCFKRPGYRDGVRN